jgi:hypothetical protein
VHKKTGKICDSSKANMEMQRNKSNWQGERGRKRPRRWDVIAFAWMLKYDSVKKKKA